MKVVGFAIVYSIVPVVDVEVTGDGQLYVDAAVVVPATFPDARKGSYLPH